MPEYMELLRMAELDQVFGGQFAQILKNSGALGLLSLICVVAGVLMVGVGIVTKKAGLFALALAVGVLGVGLGWLHSYRGYLSAAAFVSATGSTPKQSELIQGANQMAWSAFLPTAVGIPLAIFAVVGLIMSRPCRA